VAYFYPGSWPTCLPAFTSGEWEYPIDPLPLPEDHQTSLAALRPNPAVALFVRRAQAVRPDFTLTEENASAVAAICTRLDGLPLAIELAASRVRVLPPAHILARLTQRLPLLSGGARTAPARQQNMHDAIAWSYALLQPALQQLLRRLAVFAGGCTLELADAVCNANGDLGGTVLDGVSSLLENSLLRASDGHGDEPRYRMLETIREFALGELEASGEAEVVRRQLVGPVLQLAQQCFATSNWSRLDANLDNVRAVLGWCVDQAELDVGVHLLWALHFYFFFRGGQKEQQVWRYRMLALPEAAQPSLSRARLLAQASLEDLASRLNQNRAAAELEEAISLSRAMGETRCLARALQQLALLRLWQGRYDAVAPLAEEALALYS